MKKESARGVLKQMLSALSAMVKRKSRALKARLIIHSLLSNTNFLVSSISHKLHPLTSTHQHDQHRELQPPMEEAEAEVEVGAEQSPDVRLRRSLVESAFDEDQGGGSGVGGSVIEMVKHSKEEAGEEFCLEQDIDHVADLFIRNFHRQMRMQKQNSLTRCSWTEPFEV